MKPFYPSAPEDEERKLRKYQMYAHVWMETRIDAGGGIIGDEIGLGKVRFPVGECVREKECLLTCRPAKF